MPKFTMVDVFALNTGEPGSKKDAVALGAGIAVCLLLSTTLCLFLYRRHRKRDSSEQFLSHNKSYSPSSSKSDIHILTGSTYFGVHVFTYRELEVATEYFNPAKELGEGGFGTVYYGMFRLHMLKYHNIFVALKFKFYSLRLNNVIV